MTPERIKTLREAELVTFHYSTIEECLDEIEKLRALVENGIEHLRVQIYSHEKEYPVATDWLSRAKEALK